jgi:tripartite ATP-independent transporter DctP family solute receptor
MGTVYPAGHPVTMAGQVFADRVGEATAGKVKVAFHFSGALGLERELVQQAQRGALDLAAVSTAALASLAPEMWVFQLPYLFRDYAHLFTAIDGSEVFRRYCEGALERKGLKLVALTAAGYHAVAGPAPINTPADLRGKKIRIQDDQAVAAIFGALGAVPVPIALPEVATALRTGGVDFAEGAAISFAQGRLHESIKHVTDVRHLHQVAALVMARATWARQEPAVRDVIVEAGHLAERANRKAAVAEDNALKEQFRARGLTITKPEPAPFRAATARLYEALYASPTGKDARRIVELVLGLR